MKIFILKESTGSTLAKAIREVLDIGPNDIVEYTTPQFTRTDGKKVNYFPTTIEQYDKLKSCDRTALIFFGLQKWGENNLWLFPGEWYEFIPDGCKIIDINGQEEAFRKGSTDNDIRFGALSYGIVNKS